MSRKHPQNQSIDLVESYISIAEPKMDRDCDTMRILVGGKKRAKDSRETPWVHGEIEVDRNELGHLAYMLHRIIAAEQASVDRKRAAMKGDLT
jgi:hypothetical protein